MTKKTCLFPITICVFTHFWFNCKLVYCWTFLGCNKKTKLCGCTRLYTAWRKWTSETHADSFGPYCSWFQQHHNQSWQPTSPQYKLARHQQGAKSALKNIEESSVHPGKGLHRRCLEFLPKRPVVSPALPSLVSHIFLHLSVTQSFLIPKQSLPRFPLRAGWLLAAGVLREHFNIMQKIRAN